VRFSAPGKPFDGFAESGWANRTAWTGKVSLIPEALDAPLRWRKPCCVFVNSMSDLFHESLSDEDIAAVFGVMAAAPQHRFLVLTKRAERMRRWFEWVAREREESQWAGGPVYAQCHPLSPFDSDYNDTEISWPLPNVWLGVSVEN
jgi:protein gp37